LKAATSSSIILASRGVFVVARFDFSTQRRRITSLASRTGMRLASSGTARAATPRCSTVSTYAVSRKYTMCSLAASFNASMMIMIRDPFMKLSSRWRQRHDTRVISHAGSTFVPRNAFMISQATHN
jgi:hypothetical protein